MGEEIDEELVRALLKEQQPDLADLELREVVGGWGNQMWRLGDELAVRLPRTENAPSLLLNEHRWVPELAARLPLPVQTPVRLGVPSERFPRTWLVTTWVAGEPADRTPITAPESADTLATFLRALHVQAPAEALSIPSRGVPLRTLTLGFDEALEVVAEGDDIRKVWADAVAAPEWDGPPVWVHGDLHPANVVVADGTLAGVIDFGEICAGDPAGDLAAAWVLLPAGAAERFFDAYPADEATVRRARGWAASRALFLIAMGINGDKGLPGGKPGWGPAGRAALERLL